MKQVKKKKYRTQFKMNVKYLSTSKTIDLRQAGGFYFESRILKPNDVCLILIILVYNEDDA